MKISKQLQWWAGGSAYTYSTQYQAVLTYAAANGATAPSSQANKIKEDTLVRGLVSDGLWALADQIFLLCSNGNSTFSLINIKNPGTLNGAAAVSPTFTPGTGWTPNGSTQYLTTNFAPSTNGVNFTQNSACVAVYINNSEAASGTKVDLGAADSALANAVVFSLFFTGSLANVRVNAATGSNTSAFSASNGLYIFDRTSSTNIYASKDAVVSTLTITSTGLTSKPIFLGAYNNNGAASGFSTKVLAFWLIGGSIGGANHINLNERIVTFITANETVTSPSFTDWKSFSTDLAGFLAGAPNLSSSFSSAGVLVQRLLSGASVTGYQGCTLAENDCIYATPSSATTVLKINTLTDTYSTISTNATAASGKYGGAVYATNGKIYFCPQNATAVMVINTADDSTYFFDTTGVVANNTAGNLSGSTKWYGIYQGANGKLYCMPYMATEVMVIDPSNDSISFIDSAGATTLGGGNLTGSAKWDGGCVYGNYIYGSPSTATDFLKINTSANTCARFGTVPAGTNKWAISTLGPNGYIYMFPYFDNRVLKLNPADDTFAYLATTVGSIDTNIKFANACVMADGKILATRADTNSLGDRSYVLDTSSDSLSATGGNLRFATGTNTFIGGCVARNGALYSIPFTMTSVLKQYYASKTISLPANFVLNRNGRYS